MVTRVASVDGVGAAVPLIQAVTLADGRSRTDVPILAVGYDCGIRALVGEFVCDQSAIEAATTYRPPAISPSLYRTLGPDGVVRSNEGSKPLRGALPIEELEKVNGGRVVAFPIHVAQGLYTRPGRVDVIYVFPTDGTDTEVLKQRLEAAVGANNSVLAADEPSPQFGFLAQLYVLLGMVGIGTLATGGVLAHNSLALSLEDRRRDLAVAAAIGAKPRTIFGGALVEGAALGLVGGLLGASAGIVIAYPILASFQFLTERIAGLTMTVHLGATPFIIGAVLGVALGTVAAIKPARRASRLNVVAEIQGRSAEEASMRISLRRPLIVLALGIVGILLTRLAARNGALEPWQPLVAQPAAGLAVIAFMSAVGQFAPLALSLGARMVRGRRTPTRMAWTNLVGEGWRSASMVLAAGGAIAAAFMIANMGRIVVGGLEDSAIANSSGSVVVTTLPLSNSFNLDTKPSPELTRKVEAIAGVAAVRRNAYVSVVTGGVGGTAEGTLRGVSFAAGGLGDLMPSFELLRGRADEKAFARGEILIGPGLARRDGIAPGETIRLPGLDGFTDVRVQGIVANGDTTGLEISMPLGLLERIWGIQPPGALQIEPQPGVSTVELANRIEAARLDPNLNALAEPEFIGNVKEENSRFFAPFWALQRALVVIAFAAVLSNLLLVALRRKRELGLVAAVGMSPEQMGRMVVMEAIAIGLVAVVLGTAFALGATEGFRHVMNIMIPYPMPFRIDPIAPIAYGAITLVVLVAAAAWPAWRTSRLNVVEALRYE